MPEYTVSATRAPELDEQEVRRRLAQAYKVILQAHCRAQATRLQAEDAPEQGSQEGQLQGEGSV